MDKKKLPIGKIQTFGIILLSLSAVFLLLQTPLFDGVFERENAGKPVVSQPGFDTDQSYFTPFALPLKMALCNGSAHCAYTALTTESSEFKSVSATLAEAIASAQNAQEIAQTDFLDTLSQSSIYFDFTTDLPSGMVTDLLAITADTLPETIHRLVLLPGGNGFVSLFVQSGADFLRYDTQAQSESILHELSVISDNGFEFAGFLGKEYAHLSPFTLLSSSSPITVQLSANTVLPAEEDILRLCGMNPHTESRYTDSNGTRVVREGDVQLNIQTDGTVTYSENISDSNATFVLNGTNRKELIYEAEQFAQTMLGGRIGDAKLFVSSVREKDGVLSVALDTQVDGVPIRLFSGMHAVYVEIKGQVIRAFHVVFRSYLHADTASILLPAKQAAAIIKSEKHSEMEAVYVDRGFDAVDPGWIPLD